MTATIICSAVSLLDPDYCMLMTIIILVSALSSDACSGVPNIAAWCQVNLTIKATGSNFSDFAILFTFRVLILAILDFNHKTH